jgi:endonuclease/exonuclease/phosphatase family metal-dependent hydrolase
MSRANIPFIASWKDGVPFSDLGEVAKVDSLSSMLENWTVPNPVEEAGGGVERQVGVWNTVQAGLLPILAARSRAVARISVPAGGYVDFEGRPANSSWTGTGFLVAPNLLLTNHHVINNPDVAEHAVAEFRYELLEEDLLDGPPDLVPPSVNYRLNPSRLFITSPLTGLDYTFVWIEAEASEKFGYVPMQRGAFSIKPYESTYIIHHPNGRPKEASLDDTELLSINATGLLYAADTEFGSSGAPVFCSRGRLVGLHHAFYSVSRVQDKYPSLTGRLTDGTHTRVVNEGLKLSAIAIELELRMRGEGPQAEAAETVLEAFQGSDTLTGVFGSLGRNVQNNETSSAERVVQVYQGRDQDIDVGAWNIEWLSRNYTDRRKLQRVASVITDLNLDVWALSEVSPNAVRALVKVLKEDANQTYEYALSEPDASDGKQSTAVIWRPNILEGSRERWPDEIQSLFEADSRDDLGLEAKHGKIFNRYPGLFRFKHKGCGPPFDFFLVPLHLKAKSEGSLRRRLASKVLAFAVERMISHHGADDDWILLGDVNSTLASGEFDNLTSNGFSAMSAADEAAGAVTYIKSPYASLIDTVFLSSNLRKQADDDAFSIVAADKVIDGFTRKISDHRPIAMRLSLSNANAQGLPRSHDMETAFSELLARVNLPEALQAETASWSANGTDKSNFLLNNRPNIQRLIADANTWAAGQFSLGYQPLTETDFWVVFFAEAGITGAGLIDTTFVHSAGEHGILPLPDNIRDWIGPQAPKWNKPMDVEANLSSYAQYLVSVKNKRAISWRNTHLYRGLFDLPWITEPAAAKLLAGVIHGYFVGSNFQSRVVPYEHVLEGYRNDEQPHLIMQSTDFRHANRTFMEGRSRNIEAGLRLVSADG